MLILLLGVFFSILKTYLAIIYTHKIERLKTCIDFMCQIICEKKQLKCKIKFAFNLNFLKNKK
jgi:hypothetical protein